MRTRHLVVLGLGIAISLCGCGMDDGRGSSSPRWPALEALQADTPDAPPPGGALRVAAAAPDAAPDQPVRLAGVDAPRGAAGMPVETLAERIAAANREMENARLHRSPAALPSPAPAMARPAAPAAAPTSPDASGRAAGFTPINPADYRIASPAPIPAAPSSPRRADRPVIKEDVASAPDPALSPGMAAAAVVDASPTMHAGNPTAGGGGGAATGGGNPPGLGASAAGSAGGVVSTGAAASAHPASSGANQQAALTPGTTQGPATRPAWLGGGDEPHFAAPNQAIVAAPAAAPEAAALADRLERQVRDDPTNLAAQIDYQLYRFIRDEPVPRLAAMAGLEQEDREIVAAVVDGLVNFRSAVRAEPNLLPSRKVQPLLEMADRIRAQAELTIPTAALCSRVDGFGVYQTMSHTFKSGLDNQTIIYCEVENFSSRQNDRQMWETRLSQEVALYNDAGQRVWSDKGQIPPDLSHHRRRDFYTFRKITLPRTLPAGQYVLKATIIDENARRLAENSLPIELLAR